MNVYLRPFEASDAPRLAELANNPKIAGNLRDGFPHPYTLDHAEFYVRDAANCEKSLRSAIIWEGEYVGNIGIHFGEDIYSKSAELGYFVGEPYWGKGIGTEAVRKAVKLAFESLDLMRIYAGVFDYNVASMKILEKCGFQQEGIARQAAIKNGKVLDEHRYAILRSEWG